MEEFSGVDVEYSPVSIQKHGPEIFGHYCKRQAQLKQVNNGLRL
jgi:hypothetical protein